MSNVGFWKLAQEDPSRVAVIEPDGRETSAGALLRAANQVVHALRARGLGRGDTIAAVLGNEVAMLELFLAAWQAGWYLTPINGHLAAPEIAYIGEDSGAKVVVRSDRTAEVKRAADVSSLRHVIHSAAPCPVDVKRQMLGWWGEVIYEYYAASEGGGTTATPGDWLTHPGTVGKAWPISRLMVVRDDGVACAPGEVGTVYMSMGQHRFEYHRDKKKTESSWRDDFFTVGDAGYLDAEGFLFLCDRKSDLIISGGVNIYPAEIEAVLHGHPAIADVAVFGVPDDDWGESIKAVVEPAPGAEPGAVLAAEVLAYCREHLAAFKCPRTVDFTAALPRDPNGKLYKRKLRDPYWQGRDRAI